ncbi:MAG: (2Fe-2S) ferredoxin domain-containing protein [Eubacteriales bacterium]
MKTLKELEAIKEKVAYDIDSRIEDKSTKIVVGMGTCGIAAGARAVVAKFLEEISARGLTEVSLMQSGYAEKSGLEPTVDVIVGKDKVTYVKVTPEKASKIIDQHIVNGKVIKEYTA